MQPKANIPRLRTYTRPFPGRNAPLLSVLRYLETARVECPHRDYTDGCFSCQRDVELGLKTPAARTSTEAA